jgi:hypothetical protein
MANMKITSMVAHCYRHLQAGTQDDIAIAFSWWSRTSLNDILAPLEQLPSERSRR